MTHHVTNVNFTEAELFAIRYGINHTIYLLDINHIIIITDTIPAARQIFDMLIHLYQLHSITILKNLKKFFNKDLNNIIEFWDCLDSIKQLLYILVNKEIKHFKINTMLPSKSSWKFSRKEKCNFIIQKQQMIFQALEFKGKKLS